jgi:hypothetical protein
MLVHCGIRVGLRAVKYNATGENARGEALSGLGKMRNLKAPGG